MKKSVFGEIQTVRLRCGSKQILTVQRSESQSKQKLIRLADTFVQ